MDQGGTQKSGSYCKVIITPEVPTGLGEHLPQGRQAGGSVPGNLISIKREL